MKKSTECSNTCHSAVFLFPICSSLGYLLYNHSILLQFYESYLFNFINKILFTRYEEALELLETLINRDETHPAPRKRRVAILKARGKIPEAIKELNEYLKKYVKNLVIRKVKFSIQTNPDFFF